MQEEVENKSLMLAINTTKMTARALKNAISKYLGQQKQKSRDSTLGRQKRQDKPHQGKQSVKKLTGQGQDIKNIEITDRNIGSFKRVARKYGMAFALKKDTSRTPPRYLVFFQAKDADTLTAAFKEYSGKNIKREKKPSVLTYLRKLAELLKNSPKQEKKKEMER